MTGQYICGLFKWYHLNKSLLYFLDEVSVVVYCSISTVTLVVYIVLLIRLLLHSMELHLPIQPVGYILPCRLTVLRIHLFSQGHLVLPLGSR